MLRILFLTILLLFSLADFAQHFQIHDGIEDKQSDYRLLSPHARALQTSMADYDLKYHRFNWFVDPDTLYIEGQITSYFVSKSNSLDNLVFELTRYLIVDSILYHENKINFSHQTAYFLEIDLPVAILKNELDSVTIFYHGAPEQNGSGSFVKDMHDTSSIIWTLSEPYGSRDWWPCKQSLNDKIDSIDVIVKTTLGNRVASNGVLVADSSDTSFAYFHWKHRYPIPAYLVAIAVTNYVTTSNWVVDGVDSLEILNYIYPEDLSEFWNDLAMTVPIMELFIEKFGPYPFDKEKYGHAQFGRNGGMEHQTMSFMGHFRGSLVAHELAHQWFGDKITCQSWEEIWINESFATFCDALYYEYFRDKKDLLDLKKSRIQSVTNYNGGSVYVYGADTNIVSRVFSYRLSYQKGAMVLNMLRLKLGDSLFFKGIRGFLDDPNLVYNYASTEDIRWHFEQSSGVDLEYFFNDWIYNQGFPSYSIDIYPLKNHLSLEFNQTQSHQTVDYFELAVPIRFYGSNGEEKTIVFHNDSAGQIFEVDLGFEADSFAFDPEFHLISKNNKIDIHGLNIDEKLYAILYPNPVIDQINLQFLQADVLKNVQIIDYLGRIVRLEEYNDLQISPGMKISIPVEDIFDGAYIVVTQLASTRVVHKFVKP